MMNQECVVIAATAANDDDVVHSNDDVNNDNDANDSVVNADNDNNYYESNKPKWWKKLSGRKATKRQRQIINEMKILGYFIDKPKYNTFLDLDNIFLTDNDTNNNDNNNNDMDHHTLLTKNHTNISDTPITTTVHKENKKTLTTTTNIITMEQRQHNDDDDDENIILDNDNIASDLSDHENTIIMNHQKKKKKEYWIELGFGNGDNLLCLTHQTFLRDQQQQQQKNYEKNRDPKKYPLHNDDNHEESTQIIESYYIGAEIHPVGIGNIVSKMYQYGIQQQQYWTEYQLYSNCNNNIDRDNETTTKKEKHQHQEHQQQCNDCMIPSPYSNVRIYSGDGVKLLSHIISSSIHHILITFPDPFAYDVRYRILQISTLYEIYRILYKPIINDGDDNGGRLYLATDDINYYKWVVDEQIPKMNHLIIKDDHEVQQKQQQQESVVVDNSSSNDVHKNGSVCKQEEVEEKRKCYSIPPLLFHHIEPCPDRQCWLPAISKYELKAYNEGRQQTYIACWEIR